MGSARHKDGSRTDGHRLISDDIGVADLRRLLLPEDGEDVCRCGLGEPKDFRQISIVFLLSAIELQGNGHDV